MIVLSLLFIALVLVTIHLIFNYNRRARLLNKIPGPKDVFIFGNALEFLVSPAEMFRRVRKYTNQCDGIFKFWAFPIGTINIYTPEAIESIIATTKFMEKSKAYVFLKPWLQEGLLISSGTKWQHRRKILTPAFHFNILRRFCVTMQENAQNMVETLEGFAGKEVDVIPVMADFTLNAICETAMGTNPSKELVESGKFYKSAICELGKLLVQRVPRIFLHPQFIFDRTGPGKRQKKCLKTVHNFTKKVIKERKEYFEKNQDEILGTDNDDDYEFSRKRKKTAMLDLLILAQKDNLIDDVGIQEEVDTFMFEGHDTTATGLTYCLMILANHKNIQEKIYKELESIFGDSNRPATIEDLSSMKYLECCIKESLRLYPPVPFISRKLTEDVIIGPGDHLVPEGTYCHIHIYDLHRREDLYPNPLEFNPDRFLPQNCIGRHPFAYIPFSAGPRNCIGQKFAILEMKTAVSAILRQFELAPVTRPSDIEMAVDLVLRSTGPVYISFIKREKCN